VAGKERGRARRLRGGEGEDGADRVHAPDWAQEAQRSGKERDELVRTAVLANPLAPDARARLGLPDAGLAFGPELEDRLHAGDGQLGPGSALAGLTFDVIHSTPEGHGLGFFASSTLFAEPALDLLGAGPGADLVGWSELIGVDGWLALGANLELYGRAEQWYDSDETGGRVRAPAVWRDAFGDGGPFLVETYVGTGSYSNTAGLRASGRKRFEFGAIGLSWDSTDYDAQGVDEKLLQHTVRADVDFALGRHWSLGVYARSQEESRAADTLRMGRGDRAGPARPAGRGRAHAGDDRRPDRADGTSDDQRGARRRGGRR